MSLKEYKPGTAFTGVIGRTFDVSSPAWPEPLRAKENAPNVLFIVQDDTGFGQMGCYGSPIETPNIDALAQERPALQQHAHDGAVLADALVHSDRPQPPLERHGVHHRRLDRLSGRERLHPVRERLPLRDAAAEGLQHVCARQVAPDAGRPDLGRRPVRSLAARARLRAVLRVPGWRHPPVLPGAGLRQPRRRAGEDAGRGLPPDGGPGRQGDQLHRRRQAGRTEQAVLHVLRPGRGPCAASRAEGVGGQVQGQVRRRVGCLSGAGLQSPEGAGHHPEGRRALAPRSRRAGLERRSRPTRRSCMRA